MLHNANHFVINGTQLTTIENNDDAVSTMLLQYVAVEAMFDAAERYPPGRCHPGTRERMINQITEWIEDTDAAHAQRILWLHGPAGVGKSALMQTMCEHLRNSRPEIYTSSFFFARGHKDRGNGTKLFLTLAYQLAVQFPSVRAEVNNALQRDPSLLTKSIDIQLLSLIINPLSSSKHCLSHIPVIIIDGLDECGVNQGINTQRKIVTLISESIVKHNVPLRFVIASRPECWIRDTFNTSPLPDITFPLSFRDNFDADEDIRAYLTDGFEKIRLDNLRIMQFVETPWPPRSIIAHLVEQASGQFIYASTVLKFVGKSSRFSDPQKQLRIITTPGPHRASAFSELDRLYETILSAYPRWETMKSVLGGFLAGANLTIIEVMLGVERTEIPLVLDALSSLIDIRPPKPLTEDELFLEPIFGSLLAGQERVEFCHLSFREFLEDEMRSGPFHVDVNAIRTIIWSPGNIKHFVEQASDHEGGHLAGLSLTPMAISHASTVDELHGIRIVGDLSDTQTKERPGVASPLGQTLLEKDADIALKAFKQSQHMFNQAHDFRINGGEFYNVAGSLNIDSSQDSSSHSTTVVHVSQCQHGFNHVAVSENAVEPPDNQTQDAESNDEIPDTTWAQIEQEMCPAKRSKWEPDGTNIQRSLPVEVTNVSSHLSALECCLEVDNSELENDAQCPMTEISTIPSSPIVVSDGELLTDDLIHDMLLRYPQPPIGNLGTFQRILTALLFSFSPLSTTMIAALFGLDKAQQVKQILLPASPFIIVSNSKLESDSDDSQTPVRLINSSFSNFFRNRMRSRQYYLDRRAAHRMLLDACTRVMEKVYVEDWRLKSTGWKDAYVYACLNWERHLRAVRDGRTMMRSKL